jgi:hypothetical protein
LIHHAHQQIAASAARFGQPFPGNPNDFWGTGSGEAFVTDQKIVKGLVTRAGPGLSPGCLLWSLNALIRVTFSGGSTVWSFDTMDDTISVLSPSSIVAADGVYYWPGVDKFYMFAGSVREIPNPNNLNWFFDNMNWTYRMKAFALFNSRWGEIWFCAPLFGNTECSHAVIFNTRTGTWYDTILPNGGRSAALSSSVFPYPIMTGVQSLGSPQKYRLWQHEIGLNEVNESGTVAVRSYFTLPSINMMSNQQSPMNRATRISAIEPDLAQVGDMTVNIYASATATGSLKLMDTLPVPVNHTAQQEYIRLKRQARHLLLNFESNTLGGDYQLNKTLAHIEIGDGRETQ